MATPQKNDATNNRVTNTRNVQQNSYRTDSLDTTRNVRTSAMPGSPKYQQPQTRATVAEEFSQSYQDRLIQPQSLTDTKKDTKPQKTTREEEVIYMKNQSPTVSSYTQKKERTISSNKTSAAAHLRATSTNVGILSWGLWAYGLFQIPMAIFALIFFGLAGALDAVIAASEFNENDGFFVSIGSLVIRTLLGAGDFAARALNALTGFDITVVNPANIFLFFNLVVFFFGICMLLSMYLIYVLRRLRPLSGQATGLKYGVVILAIIGYGLPFLNLFPWFLVWAAAVWKYPK